ncbi:hypothetical protein PQU95_07930 [Vogesella sp. DC21W]|uniref:Uncharacterized protein n=1 Tax=Vogesella aquatica TaxID=2984206 RepID=A0ABT5IX63_9NEIS|nr:hypothetical protein [Vogesella aquatica]MDC7717145.1 hypothetical protein [Vogesella aquatica]
MTRRKRPQSLFPAKQDDRKTNAEVGSMSAHTCNSLGSLPGPVSTICMPVRLSGITSRAPCSRSKSPPSHKMLYGYLAVKHHWFIIEPTSRLGQFV